MTVGTPRGDAWSRAALSKLDRLRRLATELKLFGIEANTNEEDPFGVLKG